jgi:uncharacterized protein YdhG (YjbR/CyaY superfamily)
VEKRRRFKDIDEYIAAQPTDVQTHLEGMRSAIREAAPEAEETISYAIPTFKLHGYLVHFGAFKDHVSFFPTSSGVSAFKKELTQYKTAPGTIQFPLDRPVPYDLVRRIILFRVKENSAPRKRARQNE